MISYVISRVLKKLRLSAVKNAKIDKTSKIESGTSFICSTMSRHSFCGYDCTIISAEIGPFCSIGSNVRIGGVAHPVHFVSTSPVFLSHRDSIRTKLARHDFLPKQVTRIGSDVWIGDGAFVKAGVTIGHGAVIGMGAVVTRDVLPYSIVGGNPARLIKRRFPDEICEDLLVSQWWNLNDSSLAELGHSIVKPQAFVEAIRRKNGAK